MVPHQTVRLQSSYSVRISQLASSASCSSSPYTIPSSVSYLTSLSFLFHQSRTTYKEVQAQKCLLHLRDIRMLNQVDQLTDMEKLNRPKETNKQQVMTNPTNRKLLHESQMHGDARIFLLKSITF